MMSWHYFSFVLSITVLHVFEETEIPKSGLEIVQIVWERRRKAVLSLCTERVGLYLGTIGTLEMHFPIIICQATCRLHPEICKRCWTNKEDKYRANMERQFAKLLRKRGANAAWCTIIIQQGATIPDICQFLDTTALFRPENLWQNSQKGQNFASSMLKSTPPPVVEVLTNISYGSNKQKSTVSEPRHI